jgi:hypothetical protein
MGRGSSSMVLSNWHTLFEGFSTSTQEFYQAVEAAVARRNLPEVELSRVLHSEGGLGSANREYLRVARRRVAFDICSAPYGNGHFFSWWLAMIPARFGLVMVLAVVVSIFGCFALVGAGAGAIMQRLGGGCAVSLAALLLPGLGAPIALFGLGWLVERGLWGDEEWLLSVPYAGALYAFFFKPTTYYRLDTAMMFRDSVRAAVNEVINEMREAKGLRALEEDVLRPTERGGRA